MRRRTAVLAGLASFVAGPAFSQGSTPTSRFWFDPTQLPSFNGMVERYLLTPEGKTDRLLFREGPQVLFPEHVADEIMAAVPTGQPIVVYGIRARRAPVITLLAWAREGENQPHFVDRPSWTFPEYRAADERLQVAGVVRAPLYTPQGDVIGVVLDEGVVVRLPAGVAVALADKLNVGRTLAASGRGASVPNRGKAIDADQLGDSLERLEPLPALVNRPR